MNKKQMRPFGMRKPPKNKLLRLFVWPIEAFLSSKKKDCSKWVSPPKKVVLLTALLLVFLNAADALLTEYGVQKGWLQEVNLFPQILLAMNLEVFVGIKVLGTSLAAVILYRRAIANQRYAWYTLIGFTICIGLLCTYMIVVLVYAHSVVQVALL